MGTRHSAYNDYPKKYKFIGVQINIDNITKTQKRITYDFISLLSAIGGTESFGLFVIGKLVAAFSILNYQSLVANRFYTWNPPESFKFNEQKYKSGMMWNCFERKLAAKVRSERLHDGRTV